MKQLAASVSSRYHYVQHLEETPPKTRTRERWDDAAYYRISAHYRFALSKLFDGLGYPRVIVLEDDMELAPDFFSYFEALGKVMDADPSVYAVSSWNDNGQKPHAWDDRRVYRSDFSRDSGGCSTTDCGQSSPHLAGQFLGRLDAPALDEKRPRDASTGGVPHVQLRREGRQQRTLLQDVPRVDSRPRTA